MRTETKILLTAIRNACKHDQRIDDFLKGFTMQIPIPIMKAKLDENADILGVVLTELYEEMNKEISKQQEQPPASTKIEEQLDETKESEVPNATTNDNTNVTATTGDSKFIKPASTTVNPTQILIESMEEKSSKKKKSKSKSNK